MGNERAKGEKCQSVMQRYGMEKDVEGLARLMRCPTCGHKQRALSG